MLSKISVATPKDTPQATPVETRIAFTRGIIDKVEIDFPAGCAGLAGARILRGNFQLWPITTGEWFATDDFIIGFPDHYVIDDEPLFLTIQTYNTDTIYEHTLSFRFSLVAKSPDPVEQMAEIARRIAETAPAAAPGISLEAQQALLDIRDLLYIIHASDLPLMYAALTQPRE